MSRRLRHDHLAATSAIPAPSRSTKHASRTRWTNYGRAHGRRHASSTQDPFRRSDICGRLPLPPWTNARSRQRHGGHAPGRHGVALHNKQCAVAGRIACAHRSASAAGCVVGTRSSCGASRSFRQLVTDAARLECRACAPYQRDSPGCRSPGTRECQSGGWRASRHCA
jgi:hypothetical protein